ncbi:polypeptide N-acetylgalactosaminyltransferase 1-like isoform X2 [Pollicipes pollicipes]|uniref:polypeptide N-acetylgalactosaminyltransferase 1-like isoform X2 n=1 Tax=Pollicipes pollicipes TaxID=41117 RepID=UPI00188539D2|nr:polypeptide N-acetylgalactosaminyltransferase 1-like isoform X2 [Pollicipes pollicipes]
MYSFFTSRRKRTMFYKAFGVVIVVSCIVLWKRKGFLRSSGDKSMALEGGISVEEWDGKADARQSQNNRMERSGDSQQQLNELGGQNEALPIKSVSDFDVLGGVKLDDLDDKRNAFGMSHQKGLEQYDSDIEMDLKKIVPGLGADGEPAHLSGAEEAHAEELMKKEAFNIVLSDKISPNRSVPDARSKLCLGRQHDHDLPTASVIIIFTNEAFSSLVRTIHSVINRTPARLLKQIILVDDFSDRVELGGKLERYIERFFNAGRQLVQLIRLSARSGLIRARLAGARAATGDVLVFLDSHCECGIQWMEPLLQRIKEDHTAVLTPIIDVIDDKTLQYYNSNGEFFQVGGFTWSGHFTWIDVPEWEQQRRGTAADPTRSPTMAGGLFAIDRQYFWESGSYDEGMDVWGGENLEMSFRIWMCGGKIETIPCSRVGHIFRDFHPYSFPGNKDTHGINTARLAEVWMDDYKRLFYLNRPDLQETEIGSVSERRQFRQRMQCHTFKWYLENVLPQKFIPDENVQAYGRVTSAVAPVCLDNLDRENDIAEYYLGLYDCVNAPWRNEMFSLSALGQLRREEVCASVQRRTQRVVMSRCSQRGRDQIWTLDSRATWCTRGPGCAWTGLGWPRATTCWRRPAPARWGSSGTSTPEARRLPRDPSRPRPAPTAASGGLCRALLAAAAAGGSRRPLLVPAG